VAIYDDMRLKMLLAPDVFQRAPDAMIVVDLSGIIRVVNEQASVLTGYPETELLHQPVEMLVPEDRRGRHEQLRTGYFQDPHTRAMGAGMRLDLRRVDGQLIPVEINLSCITTGEGIFTCATARRRSG
jgi:PAS domain S-box-containing protein